MPTVLRFVVITVAVVALSARPEARTVEAADAKPASTESKTRLQINGTQFTINGEPTFLHGISYYGALGAKRQFVVSPTDQLAAQYLFGFTCLAFWLANPLANLQGQPVVGQLVSHRPFGCFNVICHWSQQAKADQVSNGLLDGLPIEPCKVSHLSCSQ